MIDNMFADLFGAPLGENVDEWEKELYILYKTDNDGYRRKLISIKTMGYKVMRNKEGFHKVIKG